MKRSIAPDQNLTANGFIFLPAEDMQQRLSAQSQADWNTFADSWNDLGEDVFMADGGRYRRRRHAAFNLVDGELNRLAHQPHYQSRDYNPLNGGIERWFQPVDAAITNHPIMADLTKYALSMMEPKHARWFVEMHQFRIEAQPDKEGRPTPEGMHRDGVDWVLVMLINRQNAVQGETQLASPDGRDLGHFTLRTPMDTVFLNDLRVLHGVTPILPDDPGQPALRDVLVMTFRQ